MTTTFDNSSIREIRTCHDCLNEEPVFEYLLLGNGELIPLCYECGWERKRLIAARKIREMEDNMN
jgi:hypothetical protein